MSAPWVVKGRPVLGFWVKLPVPEVVEVMAESGAELVVLDLEHGPYDQRAMGLMVGMARAVGVPVFVRVLGHSRTDIQPALDAGADGVLVPHVDDADAARFVVDVCRFPPVGSRSGSTATRAGRWGRASTEEYIRHGNTEVTIVAQIESVSAVASIDEITQVPGIDAIFIGPYDLSLTSGLSVDDPEFQALIERVETAAGTIALGGLATNGAEAAALMDRAYSFVVGGADTSLLGAAVESLSTATSRARSTATGISA